MPSLSVWTFAPEDIRDASTTWGSATADVATCVVVQGATVTLGEGDEGGIVQTTTTIAISKFYALKGATFTQILFQSGLAPIAGGGDKPLEFQVVQRIATTVTRENGCVQRTQTDTFEPFRAEAARYSQDPTGGRDPIVGVFVDADGTPDGAQKAYAERYERLQLIRRVVTVPSYTGNDGELEVVKVRTGQFFNPAAALFDDPPNPESPLNRLAALTLGSGAGVLISAEKFFGGPDDPVVDKELPAVVSGVRVWYQLEVSDLTNDEGYQTSRRDSKTVFGLTNAGVLVYDAEGEGDSTRSKFTEARPILLDEKDTVRTAIAGEEGSHQEFVTDSERGVVTTLTQKTLAQYLPAAEACSLELSLRQSSRPIAAVVCAGEDTRRPVIQIIDDPWVETVDEAEALATIVLRDIQAVEVQLPIPPNVTLRRGDHVTIDVPQRGWNKVSGWVDTVSHAQAARGSGEGTPPIEGNVVLKVSAF